MLYGMATSMGEDGFEIFIPGMLPRMASPTIGILKRGALSLNAAAHGALGGPTAVQLRFNPSRRQIAVLPVDPRDKSAHRVRQQGKVRSYLVSAADFLRHYRILPEESQHYRAVLVGNKLVVDLDDPTGRRLAQATARQQSEGLDLIRGQQRKRRPSNP
jgi:hypothetical protein